MVHGDRPRQKQGLGGRIARIARFVQRLFRGETKAPAPIRQEYVRRGPTRRVRRGVKGNAGAFETRLAKRRRMRDIERESRRRNRR